MVAVADHRDVLAEVDAVFQGDGAGCAGAWAGGRVGYCPDYLSRRAEGLTELGHWAPVRCQVHGGLGVDEPEPVLLLNWYRSVLESNFSPPSSQPGSVVSFLRAEIARMILLSRQVRLGLALRSPTTCGWRR